MVDLIYKELSYKIIGMAYEVFNSLGSGLKEKDYCNAFEELFQQDKLRYSRELYYPLKIRDKVIGRSFFDFMIEDKIVLELKVGNKNYREACSQLFEYLKLSKLKLGIVIRFTPDGVRFKRIPNIPPDKN